MCHIFFYQIVYYVRIKFEGGKMVFEPNFTRIISSTRRNLGIIQSVVEVKLPTNENNITEIYSVGAKSTVLNKEINGSVVDFSGVVDFQTMYFADELLAIDYAVEFKDKFDNGTELNGEILLTNNVIDVKNDIVAGGIKIVAIIESRIDIIESKTLNVLTSVCGDGSYSLQKEINYSTYIGNAFEKFDVSGDISIDGANKIYTVTPCVSILRVEPKNNYLVVDGMVNLEVCYGINNESNGVRSNSYDIKFTWEVAYDGIDEQSYILNDIMMLIDNVKVTTSLVDNGANLNIAIPINYKGYVFKQNILNVVDDVYLEKNYISVTSENFNTIDGNNSIRFKDNISGTASVLETSPFIDEVLGISANNIMLANSTISNGEIVVEGIVNSVVLYYTKEINAITSVEVEMPFVVEEKANGQIPQIVTLCVSDVSAKSKRGKEIEVSAELMVYADVFSSREFNVITGVIAGDEKPDDSCSLYIYIVKPNQTLWDIAKEMGVSVELIKDQNPELTNDVNVGDKIVIYRPKLKEY
jgi:hypothetical protein